MAANWTRENLAWLAGLIEGDGCFTLNGGSPTVEINMTDLDVLESVKALAGGSVRGPYVYKRNGWERFNQKPMYHWSVGGRRAYALVVALWPWMHSRRRERMADLLQAYQTLPGHNALKTECKNGHLFDEVNTYVDPKIGARHCRKCRAASTRRNYAKKKAVA